MSVFVSVALLKLLLQARARHLENIAYNRTMLKRHLWDYVNTTVLLSDEELYMLEEVFNRTADVCD